MQKWIVAHLLGLFVSAGGLSVVIAYAIKGVDGIVEYVLGFLLANPKSGPALLKYRVQIESLFDEVDKKSKEVMDKAAANQPPK